MLVILTYLARSPQKVYLDAIQDCGTNVQTVHTIQGGHLVSVTINLEDSSHLIHFPR